jgi:PAS domain S-box-containing protein
VTSSAEDRENVARKGRDENAHVSLPRLFNWTIIGLSLFQLAAGLFLIYHFVGERMLQTQTESALAELGFRRQSFEAHMNARLSLLREFSRLPAVTEGLADLPASSGALRGFVDSLFMFDDTAAFSLQDAEGEVIHSRQVRAEAVVARDAAFRRMLTGGTDYRVSLVRSRDGEPLWRLGIPVLRQDRPVGLLCAYLPMWRGGPFLAGGSDRLRIAIVADGVPVLTSGEAPPPFFTLQQETGFPGIALQMVVSQHEINRQMLLFSGGLVLALALGTCLLLLAVHRIGKKLFIVPHARLQAMRDDLEKEVEKRTADLKMRTVQLSIEIRERRESEIEARESGQLVSALLEGIGAAFFILDPRTGHVVKSNRVMHSLFGLSPWQISDRPCAEVFANSSDMLEELLCPRTIRNNSYTEGVAKHVDGQTFPVARYLVPMELKGEDHIGVIVLDITERKNLERRLHIAQKLESVGELASGIAHEINTPIQYVGDSVRFVKEAFEELAGIVALYSDLAAKCRAGGVETGLLDRIDGLIEEADLGFVLEEVPKACDRALDGTGRVAVIVRAMKNFAHPGDGEKRAVDINAALENTIIVAKNEWKYVAEVVTDFDPLPMVQCLAGDINQVFLNILVNAAHAIGEMVGNSGDKGTITISTRRHEDEVVISIGDTGTGIGPEIRDKIFNPFFTTKEVGKGTGQGLAIVHDIIVERHGGSIDLESEVGKGSTFFIRLPIQD